MEDLAQYVVDHTSRTECVCGRCLTSGADAQGKLSPDPGHTADLHFFKVSAMNDPSAEELRRVVASHATSACNPFDGREYNYIGLGHWLGSQELALRLMGLGAILNLWKLYTPRAMLGRLGVPDETLNHLAEQGMITVKCTPE